MMNLIDKCCVCSDGSTDDSLVFLPLLGPPASLRRNNIETGPSNNHTVAPKWEEEMYMSHFKSKARND